MSTSSGLTNLLINIRNARTSSLPSCTCWSSPGSRPRGHARRSPTLVAPLGSRSSIRHSSLSATNAPTPSSTGSNSQGDTSPAKSQSRSTLLACLALPSLVAAFAYQHLSSSDDSKRPLSPDFFIPLTINKVTRLNHDNTVIELDLPDSLSPNLNRPTSAKNSSAEEHPWRIHSIFVRQPQLQIQRPYTPLNTTFLNPSSPIEGSSSTTIQLLIKRYDDGEVSRYLHRLGPGDQVHIRGPVLTTEMPRVERIVFIAGGTGITPAHQTITSFLQHPTPNPPSISILYAAQEPVLATSLEHLKKEATFPVDFKVFSEKNRPSRITAEVLERALGPAKDEDRLVVVCGPESMIADLAGPRSRDLSQGPIGGVLGKLGYTSKQVLKL